jgi:quercetin dioxygenase-like cupin family protein
MTTIVPEHRTTLGRHLRELQVILASAPACAAVVFACTVPAATSGPPQHIHAASDEIFLILSGKLLVHADGHVAMIREAGLVHISFGIPHTFATTPDAPARFRVLYTTRPDRMTAALAGAGTGTPAPAASLTIHPGT